MAEIALEHITKVYEDGTLAVSDVDLELADGEVLVLVGPSGCGKSTALKMIAGLEDISSGELRIGGRVVNDLEPGDRDVAMVFQNYALYPHMTVQDNMAFALKLRKVPGDERKRRVREVAEILGIGELLNKKPRNLSGGQRQRVAMGRAIIRRPQAFLMDEPLSNLDAKLRLQTRTQIARLQRELGVTMIFVTHDQTEALTLGDRVAVMRRGVVRQIDAPDQLYAHPADLFVASFIGSPPMNLAQATVRRDPDADALRVELAGLELPIHAEVLTDRPALARYVDRPVVLGIRPEDLLDAAEHDPGAGSGRIRAEVDLRESLGSEVYVHFMIDAPTVITEDTREVAADLGDEAVSDLERSAAAERTAFVARLDARAGAREGDRIELTVDPRGLHFFDPESGLSIGR